MAGLKTSSPVDMSRHLLDRSICHLSQRALRDLI
jgi:hypothetical protein